ncbi:MAG TPA: DUF192 domain-containing protein [Actinomycetota bacterium]
MRAVAIVLAVGLAAGACTSDPSGVVVTIEQDGRRLEVTVEVADSPEERSRGLRFRDELSPGTGMVFIFDDLAPRTFTMEDVRIPLDLLVVRRGRLIEVFEMSPCAGDPANCLYRTLPADAAVEIPGGATATAGITPGALVDLPIAR